MVLWLFLWLNNDWKLQNSFIKTRFAVGPSGWGEWTNCYSFKLAKHNFSKPAYLIFGIALSPAINVSANTVYSATAQFINSNNEGVEIGFVLVDGFFYGDASSYKLYGTIEDFMIYSTISQTTRAWLGFIAIGFTE